MEFGQIIKKAWKITWRYRFLWVLGVFAGITGAGGGGGGFNGGGNSFGSQGTGSTGSSPFSPQGLPQTTASIERWLPAIIAAVIIWILLALLLWALSMSARAGLIWAVDEVEEGRPPSLGDAWRRGFSHVWSVLGLGLLLQLPMFVAVVVLAAAIGVPVALAIARGGRSAAAVIVPVCGTLIVGIPLVLVMGFILGIMYIVALRRIVLDGEGVIQSAKDAWRTFRARFKDTGLMWLINWGLNIAASLAVGIPLVIITLVLVVPAVFAGAGRQWGLLAALAGVWVLILIVVSLFYQAIWGTFTSALWTIWYRRMTGREQVVPTHAPGAMPPGGYVYPAPTYPAPGAQSGDAPPAGYGAPPMAGWSQQPGTAAGWSPDPGSAGPPRGQAHDPYSPPAGETRPPLDPYRDSPERPPLDPYTPWVPGAQPSEQPPHG